MINKVFLDTDIILDLFGERLPHYTFSARLFSLIDKNKVKGFTSATSITNLHYILTKYKSKSISIASINTLKTLINILPVDEKIISRALESHFTDFEDAIQYYTAVENDLIFIITRNVKDYKHSKITVCTAEDYLSLIVL